MAFSELPSSTDLGAVVVSYNTAALLDGCLAALKAAVAAAGMRAHIHVVDNASTDGSAAVAESLDGVEVTALTANRGYAAAANLAIGRWAHSAAGPALVLVMNADTEVLPGALEAMAAALMADPRVGLVGPGLQYPDGSFQHSAFHFPGFVQTALDLWPIPRLMDSTANGRYPRRLYDSGAPFTVDFPLGACMMVRRDALDRVGLMDEGYFLYCEEIDWCRRFAEAGFGVLCVPEARVVHHSGASTKQMAGSQFVALWRSRLRLFREHEGPVRYRALRSLVAGALALRAVADMTEAALGRLPESERSARGAAYRRVLAAGGANHPAA